MEDEMARSGSWRGSAAGSRWPGIRGRYKGSILGLSLPGRFLSRPAAWAELLVDAARSGRQPAGPICQRPPVRGVAGARWQEPGSVSPQAPAGDGSALSVQRCAHAPGGLLGRGGQTLEREGSDLMRTLRVGIASYEQMKARTVAIARGEYKPAAGEPKVWFTSAESWIEASGRRLADHRNHSQANRGRQFAQPALLRRDDAGDHVGAFRDLRIVSPGLAHDHAIGKADQQQPQGGSADIARDAQVFRLAAFHQRRQIERPGSPRRKSIRTDVPVTRDQLG